MSELLQGLPELGLAARLSLADDRDFFGILGRSPQMPHIFRQILRVSNANVSVLILGETGTGKELIARAIHQSGSRASESFVALNSAAIPEGLIESEPFGHERGAYAGAVARYQGKVQQADKGSLFLDEIGDLALPLQAKILRVIQERHYQRLGGAEHFRSDFRLISATNKDLSELIRANQFREDLYFRLAVFEIEVPPLRDRREDISMLASQFLSASQRIRTPKQQASQGVPRTLSRTTIGLEMFASFRTRFCGRFCCAMKKRYSHSIYLHESPPNMASTKGFRGIPSCCRYRLHRDTSWSEFCGCGPAMRLQYRISLIKRLCL